MSTNNSGMIKRHNLMKMFNEISEERIIYICAPSGYGKTVAVRQWLETVTRTVAFVSFNEFDNSLMQFCSQFCEALLACQPKNVKLNEIVSHSAFESVPEEFAIRAISALSRKKRAVFVADDLHFIQDEKILRLLLVFLKRLPENFQIVLLSRNNFPPGFSDLLLKGHLSLITAEHLRFNCDDIKHLYKKRGISVSSEKAEEIYRFTHGWAIGINALLLSDGNSFTGDLSGDNLEYLDDFIKFNVWENWDEQTREFLLNTASARQLPPSLCNVLTGVSNSGEILEKLMKSGAFITRTKDGVYHYHSLFQIFLRGMLKERGDEYVYALLEKEGDWYLAKKDFNSATDCYIRCKNHDGLAKCYDMLEHVDRNDFVTEMVLPVFKNPEIHIAAEKHPFLHYMIAWLALAEGRAGDMVRHVDQYYARYPEIISRDPSQAYNTYNIFFMRIFDFRTPLIELLGAVATMPAVPASEGGKGSILMYMPMIHRSIRDFSEFACENTEAVIEHLRNAIGWLFGEEIGLLAESLASGLLYDQGQLDKAYIHALAAIAEIKMHGAADAKFSAMATHVCILDALNQPVEAEQLLKQISAMIEHHKAYYLNYNFQALITRRKLSDGDVTAAREWLAKRESAMYDDSGLHGVYVTFTTCRAYITIGDFDSAIILLTRTLTMVSEFKRTLDIMECHILLSIALWKKKRGFQSEALLNLDNAVNMAYSFGYTQMFINEGAELSGMLHRLQGRAEQLSSEVPVSFIKMLYLRTMENNKNGLTSGQPEQKIKFTDKQIAVMKLLCEGKSYREIAEIIGIKLPTLRSHIALIYKKLDVTRETDAVAKIKNLSVFLPDSGV